MTHFNQKDKFKPIVETALANYQEDINDVNAGYNILRHVDKLQPLAYDKFIQEVIDTVDQNPTHVYLILRFAHKGLLGYKPNE